MFRYSLRGLLVLITVMGCGLGFFRYVTHFETAENVARVGWLPDSASNVSYYKSYNFTAYEFDIPESEFLAWANRWEIRAVDGPVKVGRYSLIPFLRKGSPTFLDDLERQHHATILQGWHYSRQFSGYGGVHVAYDRATGRAYYQYNPR